jgi:hypothetical protein
MKILFLDIDGVCNNQETFNKYKEAEFPIDPYMAFLVGKIQLDTGCDVVLSSSWRHHEDSVEFINKRIVPILDTTPELDSGIRGEEIQEWLDENPDVEKYAILDDDDDMLDEQLDNYFETDWETGLTEKIANAVIKHLNS